jgi:Fe-S cluster biogenesis protein NfuA
MKENERNDLNARVNKALERIRPYLEADGGGITLEEVTDEKVVKVKLHGACNGCPFSYQTLKAGVEQALLKEVPEMKELIAVD